MPNKGEERQNIYGGPSQFSSGHVSFVALSILAIVGLVYFCGSGITGAQVAHSIDISTADGMYTLLEMGSKTINTYSDQVPQVFVTLFGNERIIGTITLNSGELLTVNAVTKNGKVISFGRGVIEKPTLLMTTNENIVASLIKSKNPVHDIQKAIDRKDITYRGATVTSKVKYGGVSMMTRIGGWLGLWS